MANYVLVHGAWCGSWCFDRLSTELTAAGHNVLVADLSGLGRLQDAIHPGITLSTHSDDVVRQIAATGFDRFILVGHSYGGMVITGVAAQLGARIDTIVYIDAFLPEDGQSIWDLASPEEHQMYIELQRATPGIIAVPPFIPDARAQPHPLLTFLEPVELTGEEEKPLRKIYIYASGWMPMPFGQFVPKVSANPCWEYSEWPCGHFVMEDMPEQLLELMLNAA